MLFYIGANFIVLTSTLLCLNVFVKTMKRDYLED